VIHAGGDKIVVDSEVTVIWLTITPGMERLLCTHLHPEGVYAPDEK